MPTDRSCVKMRLGLAYVFCTVERVCWQSIGCGLITWHCGCLSGGLRA
jgi:hypothetical protein